MMTWRNRPVVAPVPGGDDLTSRQREILGLVATGASVRDIANRLGLSPSTIRNHLHQIRARRATSA